MNEPEGGLSQKQIMAIPILLSDPCIERACKKANISKVSFYKWLDDDHFRKEFRKHQEAIVEASITKLKNCLSLAVDELFSLLHSRNENIRLKVSEKIIEFNLNIMEIKELEQRIEKLERA
jgi:ACT domain-containing protein